MCFHADGALDLVECRPLVFVALSRLASPWDVDADTRVDRGLAQAIQQARLGKKMTQKQLATVRDGG